MQSVTHADPQQASLIISNLNFDQNLIEIIKNKDIEKFEASIEGLSDINQTDKAGRT